MKTRIYTLSSVLTVCFLLQSFDGLAQENEMAKAAQNPIANMYSLPFQNNTIFGVGPYERPQNVLNIQPVIPVPIGKKVNMINRIIMPVITQPSWTEDESSTGFGDILWSMYFSPSKSSNIIWGVGPVLQLGTAAGSQYGSGEFGIGPAVVVLAMPGDWVVGGTVTNLRTFGDAKENKFTLQYFANYNFPGFYLVSAPILTANWNAESNQRWIVPFGAGAGKVFKLGGKLPTNIAAHVYYNAVKPDGIGDWQTRFQLTFMIPTKQMMEQMKASGQMD